MGDTMLMLTISMTALGGLVIAAATALRAWSGWLDVKKLELSAGGREQSAAPSPGGRIELADLKERIRKLEAIATGVDL